MFYSCETKTYILERLDWMHGHAFAAPVAHNILRLCEQDAARDTTRGPNNKCTSILTPVRYCYSSYLETCVCKSRFFLNGKYDK